MSDDALKGRLVPGPPTRGPQLGSLGEYRVDKGLWRAVTSPLIVIGDGEHVVTVRLWGWCEYRAVLSGEGGAVDAWAVPLHYKEPKEVLPPTYTAGHRATVATNIVYVRYIRPAERVERSN